MIFNVWPIFESVRDGSQSNLFWYLLRSIWTGVLRGEMKGEAGGDWGNDWRGEIGWVEMFQQKN